MEEKEIDDLETAAETIGQLQRPARDETENPKKKEASSDPDRFLSEIVSMFDSDPAAEATAGKTVKKKLRERRSRRINRKEKFAYVAKQSARAREEIMTARARDELRSKVSEMIGMINGTIEEISRIKTEKKKEDQEVCRKTETPVQIDHVVESGKQDTEVLPEAEAEETAPEESLSAAEEPEDEQSAFEKPEDIQEPEFVLNNEDVSDMPDMDLSRTSYEPDQRWQIFYMVGALFLIVSIYFCITFFHGGDADNSNAVSGEPVIEIKENEPDKPHMDPKLKDMWLSNKAINADYVGNIIFDSGLVNLPVVQAKGVYDKSGDLYTFYTENGDLVIWPEDYTGNDVYIWTNWKTGEYDPHGEGGSVFMDFTNSLNDQNLIIYGHHFARDYDPAGDKLFTPLDLLLEEENYEKNKSLKLILNDEIREYVVTNVFIISISNDYELSFMRRNMNEDLSGNPDPGFFADYIEYINQKNRYGISEKLEEDDRILTLVTCMQHQPELRQIVICRQKERRTFE